MVKSKQTLRVGRYIFQILKVLMNEAFGLLAKILQNRVQEENGRGGGGVDLKSLSPSRVPC